MLEQIEPDEEEVVPPLSISPIQSDTGDVQPLSISSPIQNQQLQSGRLFSSFAFLLHKSTEITSLSFETAKACTKLGLGVTKEVIDIVGKATGLETPSLLVRSTVEIAEWIALTSVETGRFWCDFGVGAAKWNLEVLSVGWSIYCLIIRVVFGSSDIASNLTEFSQLLTNGMSID
jgi:hypothetical protein